MAGMELDEALGGGDGFVVTVGFVVGESGHQLRSRRPFGIRVLTLDLLERLPGAAGVTVLEQVLRLVVEFFHRALDVGLVVRPGASAQEQNRRG